MSDVLLWRGDASWSNEFTDAQDLVEAIFEDYGGLGQWWGTEQLARFYGATESVPPSGGERRYSGAVLAVHWPRAAIRGDLETMTAAPQHEGVIVPPGTQGRLDHAEVWTAQGWKRIAGPSMQVTAAIDLVLYHGTLASNVAAIKRDGLKVPSGVTNGRYWYMLTTSFDQAARYVESRPDAVVVEFHIPASQVWRHGAENETCLWPGDANDVYDFECTNYAPKSTVPGKYVTAVHPLAKTAAGPSWRGMTTQPVWTWYEACIMTNVAGRTRSYEVYVGGMQVANRHSLDEAKAVVDNEYGPQQWERITMPKVEIEHYYFGRTTEFTDPVTIYAVNFIERTKTAAAPRPKVMPKGTYTLYRGEGSHDLPSYYTPQSGDAGGWWTDDPEKAWRYAQSSSPEAKVYVIEVDETELEPRGGSGNFFIPDPAVRARRRLADEKTASEFQDVWRTALAKAVEGLDFTDSDDRAILRGRVEQAFERATLDAINQVAEGFGKSRSPSRSQACRTVADALIAEHTASATSHVTRGLVMYPSRDLVNKIVAGNVSVNDFIKELSVDGIGNYWADPNTMDEPPESYAYAEELAKGYLDEGDNTGEISVILVAEKPDVHGSDDFMNEGDAWVAPGTPLRMIEVRYDAGWGWKTLPARGITVHAANEPPKLTDYCKVCGERIQRNGVAARWRHMRPTGSGPHDHNAQPGGTKKEALLGVDRILPTHGMFCRGNVTLDPRVFDGDELKADLRKAILFTIEQFWTPRYGNWEDWAKVYICGSAASYWWDSDGDLDILIGIDMPVLREARPQNVGVSEVDVCAHLSKEFKEELDPLTTNFNGSGLDATFFVNPRSYVVTDLMPYAAYNVTDNDWAVRPPKLPADWGPQNFGEQMWRDADDIADRIDEIMMTPEPEKTEEGVTLFDQLHALRQRAYAPGGGGWMDWGNFLWQALSQWGVLQKLYHLKHPVAKTAIDAKQWERITYKEEGAKRAVTKHYEVIADLGKLMLLRPVDKHGEDQSFYREDGVLVDQQQLLDKALITKRVPMRMDNHYGELVADESEPGRGGHLVAPGGVAVAADRGPVGEHIEFGVVAVPSAVVGLAHDASGLAVSGMQGDVLDDRGRHAGVVTRGVLTAASPWSRRPYGWLSADREVFLERGAPMSGLGTSAFQVWFRAKFDEFTKDEFGYYSESQSSDPIRPLSEITGGDDGDDAYIHLYDSGSLAEGKETAEHGRQKRQASKNDRPLYHGTWHEVPVDGVLRAGVVPGNWNNAGSVASSVVWLTDDIDDARSWAAQALKERGVEGQPVVYEVEPIGDVRPWKAPDYQARNGIHHYSAPEAKVLRVVAAIPEGWERYVEHEREQEDRTRTADLWLPTEVVKHYAEFDRAARDYGNLEALDEAIRDIGIRVPLWIQTDGAKALLVEGNHRLALAERHDWGELPVRVTWVPRINGNQGNPPVVMEPMLKEWVDGHEAKLMLRRAEGVKTAGTQRLYRGMTVIVPEPQEINQETLLARVRSDKRWGLGPHWTTDKSVALGFTRTRAPEFYPKPVVKPNGEVWVDTYYTGPHGMVVSVLLEAEVPEGSHDEAYSNIGVMVPTEKEVTLRPGTPLTLVSLSWFTGDRWQHYPISMAVQASMRREAEHEYRRQHQPLKECPLDDLTQCNGEDIYAHPEWFAGDPSTQHFRESVKAMRASRGKPNAKVTIYRAMPKDITSINNGDWVTLSEAYARQHAMQNNDPADDWPVYAAEARIGDVWWDGSTVEEWGYWGADLRAHIV